MLEKGLPLAAPFVALYERFSMTMKGDGSQHWLGIKLNGALLTENINKDKIIHWELLWTLGVFPLKKMTWTARIGPQNQLPETVTCRSCPDSSFIWREFTRTTCNGARNIPKMELLHPPKGYKAQSK